MVMWSRALTDPLRGKTPLWKVIWIYGFGVSIAYTVLGWAFVPATPAAIGLYSLLGLAIGIVQSAMLWKCAYNSKFRSVGRLLRVFVVVGLLIIPLMLYVLLNHPDVLAPPS
jgi:hypothetical protein